LKGLAIKNSVLLPRVNIFLEKLGQNMDTLVSWYGEKGIRITPVTKGVCGSVEIARLLTNYNIHSIGDSHLQNIRNMKEAGIDTKFMLLRSPMMNEVEETISLADISLNSEIITVKLLNDFATKYGKIHDVVLMIELGDLREGILPTKVDRFVEQVSVLKNVRLVGIGSNLTCLNGIKPTIEKMEQLSSIGKHVQDNYSTRLDIISGGNSANYQWSQEVPDTGLINHLRIRESILLGTDPISQTRIKGLENNAFMLEAEVIESKRKASKPNGIITYDAFGEKPSVKDDGEINRAILAIGLQDLDIKGCIPNSNEITIIGTTSDHLVVKSENELLSIGDLVQFQLTYRALLRLMISPYVAKRYIA